jgi:hypothetical protein
MPELSRGASETGEHLPIVAHAMDDVQDFDTLRADMVEDQVFAMPSS